jgi:hypothetical protein
MPPDLGWRDRGMEFGGNPPFAAGRGQGRRMKWGI